MVLIPVRLQGELRQQERFGGSNPLQRKAGILIVDDMGLFLTLLKFELEPRGFNVWLAVDGNDAFDLYQQHRDEIDLVLLDVHMPGMDGPQTLACLQRINSSVFACFMTENSDRYTEKELLERGATCVFTKPFCLAEIGDCLQRLALARYSPRAGKARSGTMNRSSLP